MPNRNDPCPCGSGKKYKKCCLLKEMQQQAEGRQIEEVGVPGPVSAVEDDIELDPLLEQMNEWWESFMLGEYEEKWELVDQALRETPELLDGEMLFEIGKTLMESAVERDDLERFERLLDTLERERPEAYEEESGFFVGWRFNLAVSRGDWDQAEQIFLEAAPLAAADFDLYYELVSALEYHGKLETLLEGMRAAVSFVSENSNLMDWAIVDFKDKAGHYEIVNRLEQNPALEAGDRDLQERVARLELDINTDALSEGLEYRSGRREPNWERADFVPSSEDEDGQDPAVNNLDQLLHAWAYYAHAVEGVSHSKAEMVRRLLFDYFVRRYGDDLERGERGRRRRRKEQEPILYPDGSTLNVFLEELAGFLSFRIYEASALMELLPSWLRFLKKYELLDDEQEAKVQQTLRSLLPTVIEVVEARSYDPALLRNLRDAYGK